MVLTLLVILCSANIIALVCIDLLQIQRVGRNVATQCEIRILHSLRYATWT